MDRRETGQSTAEKMPVQNFFPRRFPRKSRSPPFVSSPRQLYALLLQSLFLSPPSIFSSVAGGINWKRVIVCWFPAVADGLLRSKSHFVTDDSRWNGLP